MDAARRLAHDLNNIAFVVYGYAQRLEEAIDVSDPRREDVQAILDELVTVEIWPSIVNRYAIISDMCRRNGHALGDNDRWIAATAAVTGACLLTADADFDPLHPSHVTREYVDQGKLQ